jgi:hypothetical protein
MRSRPRVTKVFHLGDEPWRERLRLRLPRGYQREQRRLWQLIIEGDGWCLKPGLQREAMEREYRSFLNYIKDPEEGPACPSRNRSLIRCRREPIAKSARPLGQISLGGRLDQSDGRTEARGGFG